MRKIITMLMAAALAVTCLTGFAQKENSPVAGKKVAYIMYMSSSPIFELWSESFTETAEALGMEADTFFCEDSDEEWKDRILQCAEEGYDGLLVSHGGVDYAWEFLTDVLEEYPDLKITTFDTSFRNENGETETIDGVVQLFQQDSGLASALVEEILAMYPDKAEKNEPVNILQVQEENYIIAFDRRQVGYQPYETEGRIKTLEQMAPEDHLNPESSMQETAKKIIGKYDDGEIDAIWCCYDAYARGVYQALRELDSDIPMVSVDLCDEDIQLMAEGKNWKACATTNWTLNGAFACRVLALEMAGQYDDIKAASSYCEDPGMWMEIPSVVVTQEQVMSGQGITVKNLSDVAEDAYTDGSFMPSCDWMDSAAVSRWQTAMNDAVFAEDEEIHPLVTLTAEDNRVIWDDAKERVLLLTWHDYPDACDPGTAIGEYGDIWATSLGEMKSWFAENGEKVTDWELRFSQLLGVHEDEGYTRFTAFWVSPQDVVRPAYVTDVTKQMANDYSLVTGEWKEWFDSNILFSYFESDYPWTRLGYTYDWGGTQEYGLTEFLVRDPSRTEIEFTLTTDEFAEYLKSDEQ